MRVTQRWPSSLDISPAPLAMCLKSQLPVPFGSRCYLSANIAAVSPCVADVSRSRGAEPAAVITQRALGLLETQLASASHPDRRGCAEPLLNLQLFPPRVVSCTGVASRVTPRTRDAAQMPEPWGLHRRGGDGVGNYLLPTSYK